MGSVMQRKPYLAAHAHLRQACFESPRSLSAAELEQMAVAFLSPRWPRSAANQSGLEDLVGSVLRWQSPGRGAVHSGLMAIPSETQLEQQIQHNRSKRHRPKYFCEEPGCDARINANSISMRCGMHRKSRGDCLREAVIHYLVGVQGWDCAYCGTGLDEMTAQVDHVYPLALGGLNQLTNFQLVCQSCNSSKGASIIGHP